MSRQTISETLRSANSQIHSSAVAGDLQSDSNQETTQGIEKASRTTVDLDKLVHLLAENAMSLGPLLRILLLLLCTMAQEG